MALTRLRFESRRQDAGFAPADRSAAVRARAFTLSLGAYGFAILVLFGGFLFLPQYVQLVRGLSAFR